MICVVVLPSLLYAVICQDACLNNSDVGENLQGRLFLYSRSPLSEPGEYGSFIVLDVSVGEIHRVVGDYYSRSPLCFLISIVLFKFLNVFRCRGDYTGRSSNIRYSRSPLYEPEIHVFNSPHFDHIFDHFY